MVRRAEGGVEKAREAWEESIGNYQPAHPLGNRYDAEIIARQSGRPIEEFLSTEELDIWKAEQNATTPIEPGPPQEE